MSYPARPEPPESVEDAQERSISLAEAAVAATLVGTEGGIVSTMTVVVAVDVPLFDDAVSVYAVVDVKFTSVEPMSVVVEKLPGMMATEEAFTTCQLRVELPVVAKIEGDAEKERTVGPDAFSVVVLALVEVAEVRPKVSKAETA